MNLKRIFALLGIPPPLWVTISPSCIYEYQILLDALDLRGTTVLDLGCGEGIFAVALSTRAERVIAVDINPEVIKRARRFIKHSLRKKRINFYAGTLQSLNLPANSIDHIFCVCVLQLVDNLPAELAEMYRILKPGGWVHATVDSFSYIHDESKKCAYAQRHGIRQFFTRDSIAHYFHKAGFKVVVNRPILAGKTAKAHFERYFENSVITYGVFERLRLARQMADEDSAINANSPSAEILIRAKKEA